MNWLLMTILMYAVMAVYFVFEGIREHYYWLERAQDERNYDDGNMHDVFSRQRMVFFLLMFICFWGFDTDFRMLCKSLMLTTGLAGCHMMWHLGTMYELHKRKGIKGYEAGWQSDASMYSESELDKKGLFDDFYERVLAHGLGLLMIILTLTLL